MDRNLITVGEASRRVGVSPNYLRLCINTGRLPVAQRTPLGNLLDPLDVADFQRRRGQSRVGKPRTLAGARS